MDTPTHPTCTQRYAYWRTRRTASIDQYATGNGQLIEKLNVAVFVGGLRHAEGFAWDARAPRTYIALGVYKDELYDTGVHARIAEF